MLGTYPEVKSRVLRLAKNIATGNPPDIVLVDTREISGLYVLDDAHRSFARQRHFQLHSLLQVPIDREEFTVLPGLFDWLLTMPWGPLALMGPNAQLLRMHNRISEHQWTTFLRATVESWPMYAAEGARYVMGLEPLALWGQPTMLACELERRGVSEDELQAPLPKRGLKEVLLRHRDKFADVLAGLKAK
jgi:hypothetical protein